MTEPELVMFAGIYPVTMQTALTIQLVIRAGWVLAFFFFTGVQVWAKKKDPEYEFSLLLLVFGTAVWIITIPLFCIFGLIEHNKKKRSGNV